MNEPVHMIVINLLASVIALGGIAFYILVYPKKKIPNYLLVIILSLLPLTSILRKGVYESGDFTLHIKFAMQFFQNLQQGIIVPEWIPNHCSSYGCPVYIFLFLLPYYLLSFFHMLGFTFITSMKLFLMLSFVVSGIGMYYWIKSEFDEKSGLVASIFYLYAPYHLIDLHFRVSIGELLSMTILPFVFLFMKRLVETRKDFFVCMTALSFGLLVLSHQVTSLVTFPFVVMYGFYVWQKTKQKRLQNLFLSFGALALGLMLSAFYWIPILVEGKFTEFSLAQYIEFKPWQEFFYSPYRFGLLFQGHKGELVFLVGYTQWLIIAFAIYLLIRKRIKAKDKTLLASLLVFVGVLLLMMQSVTAPLWHSLPILKSFQFSWRLSIELIVLISIIAAIVTKNLNNRIFTVVLCTITILYTILNWGNRGTVPSVTDTMLAKQEVFKEYPGNNEITSPIWVDNKQKWIGVIPKSHIGVLSGSARIQEVTRKVTLHQYVVSTATQTVLKENTYFYPGWIVTVNNKPVPINYENKEYKGVITFVVPKGLSFVDVRFANTSDRLISKWISGLTFVSLILFGLWKIYMYLKLKNVTYSTKKGRRRKDAPKSDL